MSIAIQPPDAANEFYVSLRNAFETATKHSDCIECWFQLGKFPIRFCFLGETLAARMTHALAHLAIPPARAPAFTVLLWDDVTTNRSLPALPWQSRMTHEQFDTVQALNTDHIYVTYNEYGGILNVYDTRTQTALFWLRDAGKVPTHEWSTPLRNILHWFLMQNDAHLIHGGAVGTPAGGVILAGKAGSGKSTTAVACLVSDLQYAADDYAMVTEDPEPQVFSIYSSAKLHGENLTRVAHVMPGIANNDELASEKATVLLYPAWREKLERHFPLRAILLPRVTGTKDTRLVPARAADTIRALTLSTVTILPRMDASAVQKLNRLIARVPSFHLELGTDLAQIPDVISDLLESASF